MKRVVIFASGSGSNAENLIKFFQNSKHISVIQVFTNNPHAKVIDRCNQLSVSCLCFNKTAFYKTNDILDILKHKQPDLIVLAGFLWKFPKNIIDHFSSKIINIHPSLLPKYGGKGMYGMHVHNAIIKNNEAETGITIHYVNEHYDDGAIIFQTKCSVLPTEDAEAVSKKINKLEIKYFPEVIENLLNA